LRQPTAEEDEVARSPWGEGPIIDIAGGGFRPPRIPRLRSGTVRVILLTLVALLLLWTTYYQVEPEEVGVIQRFGAYVRTTGPGPHLKLPFGVERVTKVPVQRQLKMEFGFRTTRAGVRSEFAQPADARAESLMLTGDLNVAVVEWIVQYRIKDPKAYLFSVRNVPETFRYMSEAAVRQVVGDHSVDEVITIGRAEIALAAREELQRLCDLYGIGIEVQQLVLQDVNPPGPVRPAFNEVNQAIQEKVEIVRSSNRAFEVTGELEGIGAAEAMTAIKAGREKLAERILERASRITPEFGVEVVDVRFKRINYTESVQQAVFQRMIAERKRIAERSRSEGQGRAAEIRGQKERDVLAATSVGYKSAQELKGKADAKATGVYARAYGRDPGFYAFFKSMDTLETAFDEDATVILSTDSELLRYLEGPQGRSSR
jgi:modulator of FtsH protease HflK